MGNITTTEPLDVEGLNTKVQTSMDKLNIYITTSSKLRKKMIDIYDERLEQQRLVLQKKMNLDRDVVQKSLYSDYLDRIYLIEKEAVDKLNDISIDRETEVARDKDELYTYFDKAREDLEKWKHKPNRYESEMEYINKKESMKIEAIETNALKLFKKSQRMFDETIKVFQEHDQQIKVRWG